MSGMDLVEFLTARLNEDEEVARAADIANPSPWSADIWEPEGTGVVKFTPAVPARYYGDEQLWDNEAAPSLSMHEDTARHVARHDPARVLADIAERRSIIYLLTDGCRIAYDRMAQANREVLHFLARSYADHPDYCEEWSP